MLVWVLVTLATAAAWSLATPAALGPAGAPGGEDRFDQVLVRLCAGLLLPATGWLWWVTTATVVDVLRGRVRDGGAARRTVLLLCGVAVTAGVAHPANADPGESHHPHLAGLPLPDRATVAHPVATRPTGTGPQVRVRVGDSLWSIARASSAPGTDEAALDARWRAIWAANRHVIGEDPDLIVPGQSLRLPATRTDDRPDTQHRP